MLVTRVLGNCPECGGKQQFGNVMVTRNQVLRGCMSCKYRNTVSLPEIRKKILYLDQFFFSNAFKEHDIRFIEAVQRIRHVSNFQLLVAPFSSVHEDETHQWRGYDGKNKEALMKFIKDTSRGHEFEPAYDVEQTQLIRAFQAFLAGKPDTFVLKAQDAVDGDIHEWDNYFRIDVGRYVGDIDLIRELKNQSFDELAEILPTWRQSINNFDQDVALEIQAAAKGYIDSYLQYTIRVINGDYNALFDSPIMSMVIQSLLYYLPDDVQPEDNLKRIGDFFKSSHFSEVPYQWLSARIFATLKDMVKRGAYKKRDNAKKRLGGFFHDVKHIATYAPYCDAFVMDQAMASLVADPRIDLENKYKVKIFSLNNWDQFLAWLDALESEMSQEHRAGLAAAYP